MGVGDIAIGRKTARVACSKMSSSRLLFSVHIDENISRYKIILYKAFHEKKKKALRSIGNNISVNSFCIHF